MDAMFQLGLDKKTATGPIRTNRKARLVSCGWTGWFGSFDSTKHG